MTGIFSPFYSRFLGYRVIQDHINIVAFSALAFCSAFLKHDPPLPFNVLEEEIAKFSADHARVVSKNA
jgi:hypothetical protein